MPKRKHEKRDYEYLNKKLKKLERRIERRRRQSDSSSSERDMLLPHTQQESDEVANLNAIASEDFALPGCSYWESEQQYEDISDANENNFPSVPPICSTVEIPLCATNEAALPLSSSELVTQQAEKLTESTEQEKVVGNVAVLETEVPELDPELIEILGEDPTNAKEYGKDIQKDLAIRLGYIATIGLSKENRKELKERYLIPANCKLIKAPTLNPEIQAALVESQAKRDKGIENKQIFTSCALSSLGEAITLILSSNQKNQEVLKLLMDTARILSDIQHSDSVLRRMFILSTLKKELKDQLEKTKIDETLFGSNLAETLKSAKTINKSGAELRSVLAKKLITAKPGKSSARPLNYRAPPNIRRQVPAGGARGSRVTNPSYRTTSAPAQPNNFKTSSRQQPPRSRR